MIGDRVRAVRIANKLNQSDFGKALDVKKNTVSQWENGIYRPNEAIIRRIADTFNVSTEYLHGRTDEMNSEVTTNDSLPGTLIEVLEKAKILPKKEGHKTTLSYNAYKELESIIRQWYEKYTDDEDHEDK